MWNMYAKLLGKASSVHQHMVESEDELQTYLNEPIVTSDDVPAYWENYRFPRFKKLTKCYLAIPPATIHSECLAQRRLVQKLVFLHKNLKTVNFNY
ncbi:hypothetical protein PR048_005903 [Dryococelus australis]|uniref:HAT C-terminal dimerisation domain-containing protein n=1 Tax=Dryococelus australis TaxID=614101 RepID=A0ABQ9I9G4_9NEOP|nr:hypothetical protein PR048_005903 [Dryococelus australis]